MSRRKNSDETPEAPAETSTELTADGGAELVPTSEAPAREMTTVSITAHLTIPAQEKDGFLDHLREWGTVHELAPQAPPEAPVQFDHYGNPYGGQSTARPTHDKYGNPYIPEGPRARPAPGTTDAYGNPLTPAAPASPNASTATAPARADGRPLRDAYGNEYRGKY